MAMKLFECKLCMGGFGLASPIMWLWHFCLQALYWLLASIQALLWLFVKLMLAVICKLLNGFVFVKLGLGCFDVHAQEIEWRSNTGSKKCPISGFIHEKPSNFLESNIMSFHFMFKNFKNSFAESAMSSIPAAVKESVEQIRASEEAVLVKVEKITETLVAAGLAYRQTITPKEILVHPANRAGQMLSASDTWEKGMRLWQVGLRLPLLSDSICFEVANDPVKREEQLRKNKVLVEQNAGVLAPVTSQERFLSVSCSHRCAWLRAVAAACHGPAGEQVQLRKGDDRSDGIRLALDVGWQWLVVSSSVELACPFLADFFQRAMNAGNSNAKQLSEIECAAQIATQIMHGMSVDAAVAAVAACDPACKTSLDVIGAYVSWYGGGEHMVLIDFLSKFSSLRPWTSLQSYMSLWVLPGHLKGVCNMPSFFVEKRVKSHREAQKFKAPASDILCLFPVLAYYAKTVAKHASCPNSVQAFLAVCRFMELLLATHHVGLDVVSGATLDAQASVVLTSFRHADWTEWAIKKYHWMLHFGDTLVQFGSLVPCWAMERKHKQVTTCATSVQILVHYEHSVYQELLGAQLHRFKVPLPEIPCLETSRMASKKLQSFVQQHIQTNGQRIQSCHTLLLSAGGRVSVRDVILVQNDTAEWDCGEVWSNFSVGSSTYSLVSLFDLVKKDANLGSYTWKEDPGRVTIIPAQDVVAAVTYSRAKAGLVTLIPWHLQRKPPDPM